MYALCLILCTLTGMLLLSVVLILADLNRVSRSQVRSEQRLNTLERAFTAATPMPQVQFPTQYPGIWNQQAAPPPVTAADLEDTPFPPGSDPAENQQKAEREAMDYGFPMPMFDDDLEDGGGGNDEDTLTDAEGRPRRRMRHE